MFKIIKRDGKTVDFTRADKPTPEGCEGVEVEEVYCHEVDPILSEICEALGITFKCEFVPFSRSRNKSEASKSLNWVCTLQVKERDVYTFDYSKGSGHCYAYKNPARFNVGNMSNNLDWWTSRHARQAAIEAECEEGRCSLSARSSTPRYKTPTPTAGELMSSLLHDAQSVVDNSFEHFCADLGYDRDSRKAKTIYDESVMVETILRDILRDRLESLTDLVNFN